MLVSQIPIWRVNGILAVCSFWQKSVIQLKCVSKKIGVDLLALPPQASSPFHSLSQCSCEAGSRGRGQ